MYLIQQVTNDPLQSQTIILPNGTTFSLTTYFRPLQLGWFINNLTYGNFQLNGVRITVNPNILNQFRNQIPFGLACFSSQNNREPSQQNDFISRACDLYVLDSDEVAEYAELLANG